ncbi:hypothetical protein [Pedobacter montanisoli]|uniref:Uncharacterized protein n=1 Tax=Pedobacter montanisoli TaxID=2923277 RepID=A0ABS9ZSY4_9SPHI|nr:hypothetical protein [Pedobacter montanisoli]MCJ0741069.1 hypothetical protein [Pedobacter montanisoli]
MRVSFGLILLMFLFSCSGDQKQTEELKSNVVIEQKLSDFINQHKNWVENNESNPETTDKFQREVIHWSNEPDFLQNMPLQVETVKDTVESGQPVKVAVFTGYSDTTRPLKSLLNYIQITVNGIISDNQAKQLEKGQHYTIQASLQRQGKRADVKYIQVADFRGYDLGKYTFVINSIKPIKLNK